MANVNALLNERLKKNSQNSKMAAMAKQSTSGNLTSFSGIFNISELNAFEKSAIETLLHNYASKQNDISQDLNNLLSITSEIKSISNQAAILHGERIKKAQAILKGYRDGAFTAWLIAAYGNRQTPYNFLQYYEFCESLPKQLRIKLDHMPRQAIYTLATREAPIFEKQQIIETYRGQTKNELLREIREAFPLSLKDRRRQDIGESVIQELTRITETLSRKKSSLPKGQRQKILSLLDAIAKCV